MATQPHPLPPLDPTLGVWLDRCADLAPEYGGGLSTHLPMALHALHALGAPPQRLAALFHAIAPTLPPLPAAAVNLPAGSGAPALGDIGQHGAWRQHLLAQLPQAGAPGLLAAWLPVLLPGVGAAAFHGLIRTAHGVAAGHVGEVVNGLAYWAARHLTLLPAGGAALPAAPVPSAPLALGDWLTALQALPAPPGLPAGGIATRMRAWAGVPGFAAVAPALALQPDTLPTLARHAAALVAATGNFTLLHAVTASHALLVLQPWLPPGPAALQPAVVALAAALRASGVASLQAPPLPHHPATWATCVAAATASDDEHVIKLVHACRALQACIGGDAFLAAAGRATAQAV